VIPDRLDNDWLEYQLRPRGQTDFSDKLPPGMELPIGKVRSLLEDPSEYYASGGASLKNIESEEGLAPYGLRHSGEGAKGKGYFGVMPGKRGMVTELSTEAEGIGEHPLIVPTLTREELEHLLAGGDPTESIYNKARQHAEGRKSKGKEAFAGPSELRYPMPEYAKGGEVSGPKGFGLADVAPFVSPVSMKTGGQARTRAGTIAKPTFIDEQLGRTSERLSKLATDPQQAMRDIAAQYFPSPTDNPEEQQQKLEDLALGFTGSIKSVKGAPAVKAAKAPKIKQTVTDPQRIAFPGIYQRPDVIAAEAASRVAPESLNLKKIFGVTREDLFQMGKGREGNLPGELPGATANPRGSKAAAGVMNKKNEQRIIDAMAEAEKHPALVQGMDPWYVMDPVFQRMVKLLGKDRAIVEYQRLNTLMGMASPGSEVLTEIPRGTAANMLYKQGRFPEFVEHLGKPASQRSTVPKDIVNVPGHMYHKTAQAIPMEQYLETGALQMDSPKVPMYIEASGVPETGFQTRTPVGDAHWSRAVGLADTRGARMLKGKPVIPGASVSTPEMQALAPWWQQNIAAPLGLESVPAQARAWGTFSGQTGVTTPIGAPKIELLADKIAETSRRLGISLEQARDRVLMGEAYAGKKKGGLAHI
jgi:hypothetical protein